MPRFPSWVPQAPVVAAILLSTAPSGSSIGGPYFERVDPEVGSRSHAVKAIYQDRSGFIWVGSRDGLSLYDGYTFTRFEHDPSDPSSISDNAIRAVFQDRNATRPSTCTTTQVQGSPESTQRTTS